MIDKEKSHESCYVLMVSNVYAPTVGGITTYIGDLVDSLQRRGHSADVIAPSSKSANSSRYVRRFMYLFFILRVLIEVALLRLKGIRPIIHSHSASFCLVAGALSRWLFRTKALHTFHSPLENRSRVLNYFIPKVDQIVYVSEFGRNQYERNGIPRHPDTLIITGGTNVLKYKPPDLLRRAQQNPCEILFVGRICKEKGVLEAVRSVEAMTNEVLLTIVGEPQSKAEREYFSEIRSRVSVSKTLTRRVRFVGKKCGMELVKIYEKSSLLVFSSIWEEPAGLVVSEALSAGVPVVAFSTGGVPERLENHKNGILVKKGDIKALASSLDYLVSDTHTREKMSKSAREYAIRELNCEEMCNKYERAYLDE